MGHDLLGVVRPAIPGWNLLKEPQVTDEVPRSPLMRRFFGVCLQGLCV